MSVEFSPLYLVFVLDELAEVGVGHLDQTVPVLNLGQNILALWASMFFRFLEFVNQILEQAHVVS
jgi:hypothetical protein